MLLEEPSQAFFLKHTNERALLPEDNKEKGPGTPRTSSLEATSREVEKDSVVHGCYYSSGLL